MRHPFLIRVLVTAASIGVAAPVFAQGAAPRVLVMPFAVQPAPAEAQNAAANAWLGEAAAMLIADHLGPLGFNAFTRDERVMLFDRLQLPITSGLTRATTIRAGELVGASLLIFGEIQPGERLSVRARAVRLDTAEQIADIQEAAPAGELAGLMERLAAVLVKSTGDLCAAQLCAAVRPRAARQAPDVFENYV